MRVCVLAAMLCLLIVGCRSVRETPDKHIVHVGEAATLEHKADEWVYAAVSKDSVHLLAEALESSNQTQVDELVAAGRVLRLAAHTPVHVLQESFNERQVRIEEGPSAGARVWVPFEWLKSRRAPGSA